MSPKFTAMMIQMIKMIKILIILISNFNKKMDFLNRKYFPQNNKTLNLYKIHKFKFNLPQIFNNNSLIIN